MRQIALVTTMLALALSGCATRDEAKQIVDTLPRNPERTVALRKLLEAKDAAVRALVAKEETA